MYSYKSVTVGLSDRELQDTEKLCDQLDIDIHAQYGHFTDDTREQIQKSPVDCCFISSSLKEEQIIDTILQLRQATNTLGIYIVDRKPSAEKKIAYMHMDLDDIVDLEEPELANLLLSRELYNLQIKKKYKQSSDLRRLLSQILRHSIHEIYLIDARTLQFRFANEALLKNLQYSKNEFFQLKPEHLKIDDERDRFRDYLEELRNNEQKLINVRMNRVRKNGDSYPVLLRLESLKMNKEHYILGIAEEISEQIKQEKIRDEQRKKLEALELNSMYKSEFIATVSHEMRTTLTSVIMLSDILRNKEPENLTQEQTEFLEIIQTSNNGLLEMLNQILDLSKIEAGKMNITIQEMGLNIFLDNIKRLYTPIAREKNLEFYLSADPEIPETIFTDRIRVEQVIKNLISNALKFTNSGHIHLKIHRSENTHLSFSVEDTGIGISKQVQERIFSEFEQADSNTSTRYGGTGLGLFISKKICNMLGGDLSVRSIAGEGSTFTASLPTDSRLHIDEKTAGIEINKASPVDIFESETTGKIDAKIEDMRILLVDDSPIHNMALKEFLGFRIRECLTAETAKEAYATLNKTKVDCVILDMYLPDADGREILNKIKTENRTRNIPVIIYTGKGLSSSEKNELLEQADAVVPKSVSSYKILMSKVLELIKVES